MLFLYAVYIFRTLDFLLSGHVFELWSSVCVAVQTPHGSTPQGTHAQHFTQRAARMLSLLARAHACLDLLRAWQASRRHVDIVTIIIRVPWTPSWASQRERGGADQIEGA